MDSEEDKTGPECRGLPAQVNQVGFRKPTGGELREEQWQGAIVGKVDTNRDALTKLQEKVREVEERIVEEELEALGEDLRMLAERRRKQRVASTSGAEGTTVRSEADLGPKSTRSGRVWGDDGVKRQSMFRTDRSQSSTATLAKATPCDSPTTSET